MQKYARRSRQFIARHIAMAGAPVACALIAAPVWAATPPQPAVADYSMLSHVAVTSQIVALPLQSPPINGFTPIVAVGLTDEQDPQDTHIFCPCEFIPGRQHPADRPAAAIFYRHPGQRQQRSFDHLQRLQRAQRRRRRPRRRIHRRPRRSQRHGDRGYLRRVGRIHDRPVQRDRRIIPLGQARNAQGPMADVDPFHAGHQSALGASQYHWVADALAVPGDHPQHTAAAFDRQRPTDQQPASRSRTD